MAIQVNTSETNPEGGGGGGKFLNEVCDCHFSITDVKNIVSGLKGTAGVEVSVKVEASTVASQVGKEHRERFYLSGKGVDRFLHFACATGLYSLTKWDEDRKAGRNADFDENMLIGRQFCAPVGIDPFGPEDEKRCHEDIAKCQAAGDADGVAKAEKRLKYRSPQAKLGGEKAFTFWAVGDPDAEHVPLDPQTAAVFRGNLPTKQGGLRQRGAPVAPKPAAAPVSAPVAAGAAVAAAADLFG